MNSKRLIAVTAICMVISLISCEKKGAIDFERAAYPQVADTARDVWHTLQKSSFLLFKQAAEKVRLDSFMRPDQYYTLFIPTDAAMQAAGYTATVIAGLPIDSLKKIVLFHVAKGSYDNRALSNTTVSQQVGTLLQEIIRDKDKRMNTYEHSLFIKKQQHIYINGEIAGTGNDTALAAANGYLWPINKVLLAPDRSLWEIIASRPELSMYFRALQINDSIYDAVINDPLGFYRGYNPGVCFDKDQLSRLNFANNNSSASPGLNKRALLTVLAPTNEAFKAAGFYTEEDILAYASRSVPDLQCCGWASLLAMDSVLKLHLLCPGRSSENNLQLYSDMRQVSNFNNGSFNGWYPVGEENNFYNGNGAWKRIMPFFLQFKPAGDAVSITWSPDAASIILPPESNRHIMARNGVLYESDQLFFPHN